MAFHEEIFYWSYVLNLSTVIPKTGDLSIMWFRESYLTMEVARANPDPQFGLSESMPWILAEHLLESDISTGSLIEHCLSQNHWDKFDQTECSSLNTLTISVPFELYNDSAEAALKFFKKQHLFDELEAETQLGFEQLIHWLYTHVFENTVERALFQFALNQAPKAVKRQRIGSSTYVKLACSSFEL